MTRREHRLGVPTTTVVLIGKVQKAHSINPILTKTIKTTKRAQGEALSILWSVESKQNCDDDRGDQ